MTVKRRFLFLSLLALAYIAVSPAVFAVVGDTLHLMLAWNMLLAYLPVLFGYLLQRPNPQRWVKIVLTGLWLLFFPNAMYLLTDFIYLEAGNFMQGGTYSPLVYLREFPAYVSMFHIMIGAIIGVGYGLISYDMVATSHFPKLRFKPKWLITMIVFSLSSIGIYIGRFLRFNSWDVLNPFAIIKAFFQQIDWFTLFFVIGLTLIHWLLYGLYHFLQDKTRYAG